MALVNMSRPHIIRLLPIDKVQKSAPCPIYKDPASMHSLQPSSKHVAVVSSTSDVNKACLS